MQYTMSQQEVKSSYFLFAKSCFRRLQKVLTQKNIHQRHSIFSRLYDDIV